MKVLCLDPSGNFEEGNGTTGWAIFEEGILIDFGDVKASHFSKLESYWHHISTLIRDSYPDLVVCESFKLFTHKAKQQSWSAMETAQLIGFIRMECWSRDIDFIFQDPSDKLRVTDPILTRMGVFEKKGNKYYCMGRSTNLHQRDAIRHGIYFHRFRKGKLTNE